MNAIRPIAVTDDTVTLSRVDYEALVDAASDAADVAGSRAVMADIARGDDEAVPVEISLRLISGENPVRVWREYRGMTSHALGAASKVGASYLSEIETGKKPGSVAAISRIAKILNVSMDDLVAG